MTDTTLAQKFLDVESDLNDVLIERVEEIHSAILALVGKRHLFLFGTPGVAKSLLVDELVRRIVTDGDDTATAFKWLLTKFSVPEELYGGPDLLKLKDEGIYRRITDGKLPQADIAFLDEIFKANSAILNSLLKILNENEFDNPGDDPHVPLISLFAASNELPTSSELEALADRLHLWHHVSPIKDPANFIGMLGLEDREPRATITIEDIHNAQAQVKAVEIPDTVKGALLELRDNLLGMEIKVTDRKFMQALSVIRAEAWLNGKTEADVSDTRPLMHMMWRDVGQIVNVRKAVLDLADPIERDVVVLRDNWEQAYADYRNTLADTNMQGRKSDHTMEIYRKYKQCREELKQLELKRQELGRQCKPLEAFADRLREVGPILLEEGFGMDQDQAREMQAGLDGGS
jgi:MoxR-like ATPase